MRIPYKLFTGSIAVAALLFSFSTARSQQLTVSSIDITGNEITKKRIVLRELTFKMGDTLDAGKLNAAATQSKENLDNTLLFNFVTVKYDTGRSKISWQVEVDERWYIWPIPVIEYADRNLSAFLKNGDYTRVNFGTFINIKNFRGMREDVKIRLIAGHRKQAALQYTTFNLNANKKHGLFASASFWANNEATYASFNNEPIIYRTYEGTVRWVFLADLAYLYRPKHRWYHRLAFTFLQSGISDTIAKLNPNYFGNGKSDFRYGQIKYKLISDNRDFKIFPLKGHYFDVELTRTGILGSDDLQNWSAAGSFRKYTPLNTWLYWAFDAMGKKSFGKNFPFFQSDAVGFKNYLRGYEYYITNGSGFVICKNTLNLRLLQPKTVNLPVVPEGKFKKAHFSAYWSLFTDTGYTTNDLIRNKPNKLEGTLLYSLGAGINFVAYYDIVFRVEYSINRLGEKGIFVHFGTPFLND